MFESIDFQENKLIKIYSKTNIELYNSFINNKSKQNNKIYKDVKHDLIKLFVENTLMNKNYINRMNELKNKMQDKKKIYN